MTAAAKLKQELNGDIVIPAGYQPMRLIEARVIGGGLVFLAYGRARNGQRPRASVAGAVARRRASRDRPAE